MDDKSDISGTPCVRSTTPVNYLRRQRRREGDGLLWQLTVKFFVSYRTSIANDLTGSSKGKEPAQSSVQWDTRKTLNLNTPKFHKIGYYCTDIPRIGTLDSCNSQIVSNHSTR